MQNIKINRTEFAIPQWAEDAIAIMYRTVHHKYCSTKKPYALRGVFQTGSGRRTRNPLTQNLHQLGRMTGGALDIQYSWAMPDDFRALHPRAQAAVVPSSLRRLNLVARKLGIR